MENSIGCRDLLRRIDDVQVTNMFKKRFVPRLALASIINQKVLRPILATFTPADTLDETVEFILQGAQKVFCILAYIGFASYIRKFIEKDGLLLRQVDEDLPLSRGRLRSVADDNLFINSFYEKQWQFCAPVISQRIIPRTLEDETVLPFLKSEYSGEGGFGVITKITIHPEHKSAEILPIENVCLTLSCRVFLPREVTDGHQFACKEITINNFSFKREVSVLLALHRLANPYLISLFACYTHEKKHYLLMPYASGGNLQQFLAREPSEQYTQGSMLYLISGLGSAIWALHDIAADGAMPDRKGHHQDIHHKNILFDGTNFLLADFGLSSLRNVEENSDTPHKSRQGYCQAPECADIKRPYKEHKVTRAADIFSLGCIVTDLLVYFGRGPTGLEMFRKSIKFTISEVTYTMYHKGDAPNEAVLENLKEIATRRPVRESTLALIRLITRMLSLDPKERPKASDVASELYIATITGFAEELEEEFERLVQHREAAFERARCKSWVGALDAAFFLQQSGPTTVATLFKSVVDKLQRMVKALQHVPSDCQALSLADLVEVRQLNTELFSLLPAERKHAVLSQGMSILISDIGEAGVTPMQSPSEDVTMESRIATIVGVKRLVAAVDDEVHVTKRRRFEASHARLILESAPDSCTFQLGRWRSSRSSPEKRVIAESLPHLDMIARETTQRRIRAIRDLLTGENLAQKIRVLPFRDLHFSAASGAWLVYDFPSNATYAKPQSLYDTLDNKRSQVCVSLEARVELASKLAESMATLHDMDWFHKDLTSSCVLFFHSNDTAGLDVREPHLIGFQHSRRSDHASEGPSQDPSHQHYHHPHYIGQGYGTKRRFLPSYDFYSLGILLLEIGYWRTLAAITADAGPHHDGTFANNEQFSQHVREVVVPKLRSVTGSKYANIVEKCLTGATGWKKASGADVLSVGTMPNLIIPTTLQFKKEVVEPLRILAGSI